MKYGDSIQEHQGNKDGLTVKITQNESELIVWQQEKMDLEQYEDHFNQ
jgi:hypothetical protein